LCSGINGIKAAMIVPIRQTNVQGRLQFAVREKVDLTVVGPEEAPHQGIVGSFQEKAFLSSDRSRKAAEIERQQGLCQRK